MVELAVVEALASAEAQYTADMAAIREGLRWAAAAEQRRAEVAHAAAARRAQDERRAAARDRERGVVPGGPKLEVGPQPIYEPFRDVDYTPVTSWAPGPDWEGWAQPPAARVPHRRRRRRRAPVSTAALVVRLIVGGTAVYLFLGGLVLGLVR
jgi:hypothetical protein